MLDSHLTALYGVETKNLNKAVKRNLSRFPADFMFQLAPEELQVPPMVAGENHDESIHTLFEAIRQLITPPAEPPSKEIGFHIKERSVPYRIKRRAAQWPDA